jgi:hypothetical protein
MYEDVSASTVMVGVIFHFGLVDDPMDKLGMANIISKNLISQKAHRDLLNLGILCDIECGNEYIEILATINEDQIKDFFSIVHNCSSKEISIENLELQKKQLTIENKLNEIYGTNAVVDNIFSSVDSSAINNEFSMKTITEDDVKTFFKNKCKNSAISIIVCGAINEKTLKRILEASFGNLKPKGDELISKKHGRLHMAREVLIENKHADNQLVYVYQVPKDEILDGIFFNIMKHEMFSFLCKSNDVLGNYMIENIHGTKNVKIISMLPKKDVSLNYLRTMYDIFINRFLSKGVDANRLDYIANMVKIRSEIAFSNIFTVYAILKDACINGYDPNHVQKIPEKIKNINPKDMKSSFEKILRHNLISKITTRFKLDK